MIIKCCQRGEHKDDAERPSKRQLPPDNKVETAVTPHQTDSHQHRYTKGCKPSGEAIDEKYQHKRQNNNTDRYFVYKRQYFSVCAERAVKVTDEKIAEQNDQRKTNIHKCEPRDTHR